MSFSRRKSLALIGGGVLFAAAATTVGFIATRTPHKALAPWDAAGRYDDPRLRALSFALLAPNPHNRQPWLAELEGADRVLIYRDPVRDLPVTDPYARQLTIGMGCFLDLMRMAAADEGYGVERTLYPAGENGPVAVCRFVAGAAERDPLFAQAMRRRSHKGEFDPTPIAARDAAPLGAFAQLFLDGEARDHLKRMAHGAWLAEAATPAAWQESIDLLRIGKAEINARPDGIDAGGPMLEALAMAGVFTREAASDPENPGSRAAIEETADAILAAPAVTLTVTPGDSRVDQIDAGARWLRLNLAATAAGMALRPVSQALQEYAEVRPYYEQVQSTYADGGTVQMLGLLGYGAVTPRTPRWPLESRLIA